MVPILSHIDLVHSIQSHLFKINFCSIILYIIDILSSFFLKAFLSQDCMLLNSLLFLTNQLAALPSDETLYCCLHIFSRNWFSVMAARKSRNVYHILMCSNMCQLTTSTLLWTLFSSSGNSSQFWVMASPYGASRSHSMDTPPSVRPLWVRIRPKQISLSDKHNSHKRNISKPLAGFEPAISASERLQTVRPLGSAFHLTYIIKRVKNGKYSKH